MLEPRLEATITIYCNSRGFEPEPWGDQLGGRSTEVARILRDLANRIEHGRAVDYPCDFDLTDRYGIWVGKFRVENDGPLDE